MNERAAIVNVANAEQQQQRALGEKLTAKFSGEICGEVCWRSVRRDTRRKMRPSSDEIL